MIMREETGFPAPNSPVSSRMITAARESDSGRVARQEPSGAGRAELACWDRAEAYCSAPGAATPQRQARVRHHWQRAPHFGGGTGRGHEATRGLGLCWGDWSQRPRVGWLPRFRRPPSGTTYEWAHTCAAHAYGAIGRAGDRQSVPQKERRLADSHLTSPRAMHCWTTSFPVYARPYAVSAAMTTQNRRPKTPPRIAATPIGRRDRRGQHERETAIRARGAP
jgi:hypothetical protein